MKRYDIECDCFGTRTEEEHDEGEWVKWMDAITKVEEEEEVREALQAQLDLLHIKIIKLREVIAV